MENKNGSTIIKQIQEKFSGPVIVCDKLYDLLSSVKEIKLVTNVMEVLAGIKQYICVKNLFDPQNPSKICCKDDELAVVFGVSEFTIADVARFLPKIVFPVDSSVSSSSGSSDSSKRKGEEIDNTVMKRSRNETMVLYIPPSPASINLSDSADSSQGYETAIVKDTSDDNFYLSHDESDSSDKFSIVTIEETFDIEYEVESLSSLSSDSSSSCSDSDSQMDALKSAIITVICKSDSDMEFWADKSSDEEYFTFDAEISDADKWECSTCGDLNDPPGSICLKCFQKRSEWFASEKRTRPKRKIRSKRKRAPTSNCITKEDPSKTSQNDVCENKFPCTSSSQESYSSEWAENTGTQHSDLKQDSDTKLCFLCFERPRTGTIIHAHSKYAHRISCYPCARKLQHQKKKCPICRRKIDRVVCTISS